MVFASGQPKNTAVRCNGRNLEEIMADAKTRLNLMLPVVALFSEYGSRVSYRYLLIIRFLLSKIHIDR